jgi:hypothetical protein
MKLNFCILFNTPYMANGLALYNSLISHCADFELYIFAFDSDTLNILLEKELPHATVIPLKSLENEALLSVKKDRSVSEYCFTCKPAMVKYCINNFGLDHCTYLDSDVCFYSDPKILMEEMGSSSVLITPHNYFPLYDQSAVSGIYCAQLVGFKADANGLAVLDWWEQDCLAWCYSRYEDGKCFDQKYLDSWPYAFKGVHICRNKGAGLAPWNTLSYQVSKKGDQIMVDDVPLVFYHFHDLRYLSDNSWYLGGYEIRTDVVAEVYKPYIAELLQIDKSVKEKHPGTDTIKIVDIKKMNDLSFKYKLGIYVIDLKRSFRQFISDLFFTRKRNYYKKNFLRIR